MKDAYVNLFSVLSRTEYPSIKNRVVVEHTGRDDGDGEWSCYKDSKAHECAHIVDARNTLQKYLQGDPNASDQNASRGAPQGASSIVILYRVNGESGSLPFTKHAAQVNESISYLSLPPPIWARIKGDANAQPLPLMVRTPSTIQLDDSSSCSCRYPRTMFDSRRPVETRPCNVYGLLEAHHTLIEVQKCPNCPQGYIGPESSGLGIFNLNNRSLFTLTLLDDYTAHFTRSETPFASWVSSTACRYLNHQSQVPFVKEKTFRTAWFSFIRLVELKSDRQCLRCGETPMVTIWDGVTLSFNRKNLLPTLRPPTVVDKQSEVKSGIKPQQGLQLIPDKQLRKLLQLVLSGKTLSLPKLPDDDGPPPIPSAATKEMMDRVELVPGVVTSLSNINEDLGGLFDRYFGFQYLVSRGTAPPAYKELFLQAMALLLTSLVVVD